jgi:Zn-dependent peptidase ImmA (M78 family)
LQWQSAGEAFRFWRSYLEEQNVLVFQLSLGKKGIRGFSAWDKLAPVVAVNTAYHPTARVYTLFHELAHLHLRQDSACFSFFDSDSDPKVERWCEAFAAGYLLPRIAVEDAASRLYGIGKSSPADDPDLVRRMANRFNVSARALTIRLQQLQMAPAGLYERLVEELDSIDWNVAGGGGGGGMTSPEKRVSQLGTAAPLALVSAYDGGSITARDLSSYLNLTTNDVGDLRALLTSAAVDEIA